jgi:hypothetical protein
MATNMLNSNNCTDCHVCENSNNIHNCEEVFDSSSCYSCDNSFNLTRCTTCIECFHCQDCVGCQGLVGGKGISSFDFYQIKENLKKRINFEHLIEYYIETGVEYLMMDDLKMERITNLRDLQLEGKGSNARYQNEDRLYAQAICNPNIAKLMVHDGLDVNFLPKEIFLDIRNKSKAKSGRSMRYN